MVMSGLSFSCADVQKVKKMRIAKERIEKERIMACLMMKVLLILDTIVANKCP